MDMKQTMLTFIIVIVAVSLIGALANSETAATQANTVTNETITLVNGTAVSLDNNQLDSVTRVGNTSATLTAGTQYTVNLDDGTITSTGPAGAFNVTYVWREVGNDSARTLISFNTLFYALAMLLAVVGAVMVSFKEYMK